MIHNQFSFMSSDEGTTTVSTHVNQDFVEEFDRALKRAQIEGEISMDVSRAEALRRLMAAAIEDPTLFSKSEESISE